MNVIHLVNRADRIAGPKTRATSDSNSLQLSFTVIHGNEPRIVKHLRFLIASDGHMNVRDDANTKALVERIKSPICLRTHNLLRTHRTNRFAVSTEDIEPAVKMMTAVIGVETAAHFAHRGDDFMWTLLRIDRPDQRLLTESFVREFRQRIDESRSGRNRGLIQFSNQIVATVGDEKLCRFVDAWSDRDSGRLIETPLAITRATPSGATCTTRDRSSSVT